jgi:hypothetical protein
MKKAARRRRGCIRVWRFEDAPSRLRKLSRCGGDEDWVIYVPKAVALVGEREGWAWWKEEPVLGDWFVQVEQLPGGDVVAIAAHA